MNIKKPRVHSELIHAWADGATIQYLAQSNGKWGDIDSPSFIPDGNYRLKPKTYRYRMALMQSCHPDKEYFAVAMNDLDADSLECNSCFVKWFTDWKEVEES